MNGLAPRSPLGLALCAGAGGLELGLHVAEPGYRTVCYVERDAYAAAALVARMEDQTLDQAPVWDDVASFDGRPWRGRVDLLSAGYPCQPFSSAGRQLGAADPRHLWPHVARIIEETRPEWVFLENVPHHLKVGFPMVARDLRGLGLRFVAGLFSAYEVGASHQRRRLFVLAHAVGPPPSGMAGPADRARDLPLRDAAGGQPDRPQPCQRRLDGAARAGGADRGDRVRASVMARLPLFAPPPGDLAAWERYLAAAPALQPAFLGMAVGLACGLDRLRLCGNGVVPLAAAHAYRALKAELKGV